MSSPGETILHAPDWNDFRDHIPTADRKGKRIWLHPRKPWGPLHRARMLVNALLLLIMFTGPFIRIGGEPLLMINILDRKFVIFGRIFWPTDLYLFAIAMVTLFVMIVLFTAVFGRVWCGWLCPQTVLMEGVFRKIEYWIEGDSFQQKALAKAPWSAGKIARKLLKHGIFYALSFVVGNVLLSYIIGSEALLKIIREPVAQHSGGFTAMVVFSLIFYGIFARFREQACTFICPYGRFQSVLLDGNSIIVSYDHKRGNPAAKYSRARSHAERRTDGAGDCINCGLCVEVCPTGIDIRNGTQMECVNCTACIDACNYTMDKIGFPTGLIRYASHNTIARGERLRITPRIVIYTVILCVLWTVLIALLASRKDVEATMLRAPGTLYQQVSADQFSNLYLLKLLNKTTHDLPVELRLESPAGGTIAVAGGAPVAGAEKVMQSAAVVQLPRSVLHGKDTQIEVGLYHAGKRLQVIRTNFAGPSS